MNINIIIKEDHISIVHNGDELMYWHCTDWRGDPDLVCTIAQAITTALEDPELFLETMARIASPDED